MTRLVFLRIITSLLWVLIATPISAQAKELTLGIDGELMRSGLLKYVGPRFALKTSIRVNFVEADRFDGEIDVLLVTAALSPPSADFTIERQAAFTWDEARQNVVYVSRATNGPNGEHATRFIDWLLSDIGQRTLTNYKPDGAQLFHPKPDTIVEAPVVEIVGNRSLGEKMAFQHCSRCHVINERNKYGGIDSTPSFGALRSLPEWENRFAAFWTLNPHPSFMQVEGMTEPHDPMRPPVIAPIHLTLEDAEAIAAYAASIPPKDLGAPLTLQEAQQ